MSDTEIYLHNEMNKRILLLDGAMGTTIQTYSLKEEDFRGDRFKDRLLNGLRDCQRTFPCRGKSHSLPRVASVFRYFAHYPFCLWPRVVYERIRTTQHPSRSPGRANNARANNRDAFRLRHWCYGAHFVNSSFSRTCPGPITSKLMASKISLARAVRPSLVANSPRPMYRLSSSPTRALPPAMAAKAT